ncbi:MAG TPA: phosphohydrolase [Clostridia bacterium]|nr:phosphohydrolase [Clostridia bacterium]
MSDHITTYTREIFYPLEPEIEKINVEDIAHALSLTCRANGHIHSFFSVAQHSINCAKEAKAKGCSNRIQLACLLHDASEAYISDITRPVKKELLEYLVIEERLQGMIYNKYFSPALNDKEFEVVKEIDDAMLYCEFMNFMELKVFDNPPAIMCEPKFNFEQFENVEKKFLELFRQLFQKLNIK